MMMERKIYNKWELKKELHEARRKLAEKILDFIEQEVEKGNLHTDDNSPAFSPAICLSDVKKRLEMIKNVRIL